MNVIVVAVDVGKWPGPLHYSFLIEQPHRITFKEAWLHQILTGCLDQQVFGAIRPSLHSSHQPFPSACPSIFPLLLRTSVPPSILPFLHFFISLAFKASFTFSTQALLSLPIPCFHHPILALFPSFRLTPGTGRMQESLGPFKNVTSDRVDETLRRSVDLSFQRTAVTLLTSLISLLTAHEHGQETGAGRVLLSITSPAGADQQ